MTFAPDAFAGRMGRLSFSLSESARPLRAAAPVATPVRPESPALPSVAADAGGLSPDAAPTVNGSTPTPPSSQKIGAASAAAASGISLTSSRWPHLGAQGAPPAGATRAERGPAPTEAAPCPEAPGPSAAPSSPRSLRLCRFSKSTAFSAPSAMANEEVHVDDRKQRCSKPNPPGCQCQKVADMQSGCVSHFPRHLSNGMAWKLPRSRRPAHLRRGCTVHLRGSTMSTRNCCSPVGKRTTPECR
mmetsp:Transcript_129062/g.373477  ORF Transcript_129062/g.373477 Transcript_129062/m.373477 type:complete len:244 (+) Transcript_129062:111-842(+)